MKNRIVVLLACVFTFSSCQKDDTELVDGCNIVKPHQEISQEEFVSRLNEALPDVVNREYLDILRVETYSISLQGEGYIDADGRCQNFTLSDWFYSINHDEGGPFCGGTSYFFNTVMTSTNSSISYASVSIGSKTDPSDVNGHVCNVVAVTQDDSLIYSIQDAMFNYTVVLRSDPNKLADIRQIKQWADQRVLAEKVMRTTNTTNTLYLQSHACFSDIHPGYDADLAMEVQGSGREIYPYLIVAPRTIENYEKDFYHNGSFEDIYGKILSTHGYSDVDLAEPKNGVYLYACIRGVYSSNNPVVFESVLNP